MVLLLPLSSIDPDPLQGTTPSLVTLWEIIETIRVCRGLNRGQIWCAVFLWPVGGIPEED